MKIINAADKIVLFIVLLAMRQASSWRDCIRVWRWAHDGEWSRFAGFEVFEIFFIGLEDIHRERPR